jgi:glycosyltransferase involved in cell wall biosynthesis
VTPAIAVIVCTYNRRELVVDAVQSLVDQDLPRSEYEIVVVDNNSSDGTRDAVEARFSGVPNLRVVQESRQGLSAARNAGVRACRSSIAAFTDDDALAPPDWLRRYLELYGALDPVPAVIGGDVEPVFSVERPHWLSDFLLRPLSAGLKWSDEPHYLDPKGTEWLCEVNTAYRVEPLVAAGGFPERLGRSGENLVSGEGFVNAVLQHTGHALYYDPRLVVRHRIPPSRLTRAWFRRRMFWEGVSQYRALEYLAERGIAGHRLPRTMNVPCAPEAWVALFDDRADEADFPTALESMLYLGYLLGTQGVVGDG